MCADTDNQDEPKDVIFATQQHAGTRRDSESVGNSHGFYRVPRRCCWRGCFRLSGKHYARAERLECNAPIPTSVRDALEDVTGRGSYWGCEGMVKCPECEDEFVVTGQCQEPLHWTQASFTVAALLALISEIVSAITTRRIVRDVDDTISKVSLDFLAAAPERLDLKAAGKMVTMKVSLTKENTLSVVTIREICRICLILHLLVRGVD